MDTPTAIGMVLEWVPPVSVALPEGEGITVTVDWAVGGGGGAVDMSRVMLWTLLNVPGEDATDPSVTVAVVSGT